MRQAALALFVALGLFARAQEGALVAPRIRMPGERALQKEYVLTDKLLESWNLTVSDQEAVKNRIAEANKERKALVQKLAAAEKALQDAKKNYSAALGDLEKQDTDVQKFLEQRIGPDKAKGYAIQAELQPIVAWLGLTDDQLKKIVDEEAKLLQDDPRPAILEGARRARESATGAPMTADERKKQIENLTKYMNFQKQWLKNIKDQLTPDQLKIWEERYRRTQYTTDLTK